MFASLGNKADVSADDLLEYWDQDHSTELILMYLESFGSPRRFSRLARRISRRKPIIAVKAGHTTRGARAAQSHTGALAGTEIAIDSMMSQCGVLRVSSIEELFDVANVLGTQQLPEGRRVGIITNAGGPGILATDAAETLKLEVAPFSEATSEALQKLLPVTCSRQNPLDLVAGADADRYRAALEVLALRPDVDMFLVIFVSPAMIDAQAVAQEIATFAKSCGRPVAACIMGKLGEDNALETLRRAQVPTFRFPESAVRGLRALARHAEWRRRPKPEYPEFDDIDPIAARAALQDVLAAGGGNVPTEVAAQVLEAYGIRLARVRVVGSENEAMSAAAEVGFPVALKVAPQGEGSLVHKSDIGGIRLSLSTRGEVREAFQELQTVSLRHGGDGGVLVQEMLGGPHAKELILGLKVDPQFGPIVMVGAGGIYVEYTKDTSFRVCPIDGHDTTEMLESLRCYPILQGVRGEPPVALDVVIDALLRMSTLAGDLPEILECDINPFIAAADAGSCGAVDVRMRVQPSAEDPSGR
jgi:acyl-CoA synthetase (NDP forming)